MHGSHIMAGTAWHATADQVPVIMTRKTREPSRQARQAKQANSFTCRSNSVVGSVKQLKANWLHGKESGSSL